MKAIVAGILFCLVLLACTQTQETNRPLKIGAILTLSGPAALWGEEMRDGELVLV